MICNQCKKPLRVVTEQIGINAQNIPIVHNFGYCDTCLLKYDMGAVKPNYPMYLINEYVMVTYLSAQGLLTYGLA